MHNQLLALINQRVDVGGLTYAAEIDARECALVLLVDEKTVHKVCEFVATGAVDRPLLGQLFAGFENFFHHGVKRVLSGQPVML